MERLSILPGANKFANYTAVFDWVEHIDFIEVRLKAKWLLSECGSA